MAGRCNASQDAQDAWDAGDASLASGRNADGSDAGSVFADVLDYGIGACGTVRCSSKDFPSSLNISKDKAIGILEWNFATGVVEQEIHETRQKKKLLWLCPTGYFVGHPAGDGFSLAG